jgi:[ribosomal protein S5]-alanine N-acetyltransferase
LEVTEILTTRLRLTPLSADDFDELAAMYSDPEVMFGSSGAAVPRTREESMEWLNRTLASSCAKFGRETFRVDERDSSAFLGRCGLRPDVHTPDTELAFAFVRSAWGRGIATEAAKAVLEWGSSAGVTRVVGCVLANNLASQRVLEKVGLARIGERQILEGTLLLYEATLSVASFDQLTAIAKQRQAGKSVPPGGIEPPSTG